MPFPPRDPRELIRISVRLPKAQVKRLNAEGLRLKTTGSELIRAAVAAFLKKNGWHD